MYHIIYLCYFTIIIIIIIVITIDFLQRHKGK